VIDDTKGDIMKIDDIKTVAVVGAGDMGHGIAEVALIGGYRVNLYDVKQEFVDRGEVRILESLDKLASKGRVPADHVERVRSELLRTTTDLADAVKDADLAIEAAPEVLELKKKIFGEMDKAAPAHALLASNTSTMSITQIAEATNRPKQVLGMHYFNPAVIMKLVEVIRGSETSDEAIEIGRAYVEKVGKVPVVVRKDVPGFIANRVNAPAGVLINAMVGSGEVEPMALDAYVRSLGAPMGPCELQDYVGIDISVNGAKYYAETVHPDYAPSPHLLKMVEDGTLGKKTGKGFFDWSAGRPEIDLSQATDKFDPMDALAVQINEACKLIEMDVCDAGDVDVAMTNSSGNPIGPMSVASSIEPADLAKRLEGLAEKYGKEIFRPAKMVREGTYR
jgi:enoyl-CoA hydratase/3-hydroxyacyl-CoA dehydrogenase